ncbi:hypothetical protein D3C72_1111140 [compost metagenome]
MVGDEHLAGGRQYGDDSDAIAELDVIAIDIDGRILVLAEDGGLDAAAVDELGQMFRLQNAGPLIVDLEHVLLLGGDELHVVPDAEVGVVEHQRQTRQDQAQQGQPKQPFAGYVAHSRYRHAYGFPRGLYGAAHQLIRPSINKL